MLKKYKNYLLGVIGILLTLTMFVGVKYLMKPKYEELPEVKLREITDSKEFAIMVQNENGYEEYNKDIWPTEEYNFKEAKCLDNNGKLVENAVNFEEETKTVTLETDKTVYCTLYFDMKPKATIEILRENDAQGYLSEDLQGGMYRYQGTDDVPNWICFGTKDKDECTNEDTGIDKYMYRIIGITEEGQMYLIKETFVKEGTLTGFSWNDKYETSGSYVYTCDDKICSEWNTSLLFKRLNGTSNGSIQGVGTCDPSCDNANTDIFVDSSEYEYLKSGDSINGTNDGIGSEWYNLITDHNWMYGDTIEYIYNGDQSYAIEIGEADTKHYVGIDGENTEQTYKWPETNKVKAKISLMYIHDYIYSYYDGNDPTSRGNPTNYSTAKNGWVFFQKDGYQTDQNAEWLSTRWGIVSNGRADVSARFVYNNGEVLTNTFKSALGVRPVFYLSSKAKIVEGNGTKNLPFILN